MSDDDWLAGRFEASRPRLRAVAYRMLGSLTEAEDAVQEAWIRAAGHGAGDVANLEGWLTTIVGRVCLDMLRSRKSRREEPLEADVATAAAAAGPEQEAVLADSVGLALLVVLDTLAPAERVAFVLHDMFGLPWTTLRASQFPDLILLVAQQLARLPVIPVPAGFRFQPVDAGEVTPARPATSGV